MPLGKKRVQLINPKNRKRYSVEFVVVRGNTRSILGTRVSQQMQLLTVNSNDIQAVNTLIPRCITATNWRASDSELLRCIPRRRLSGGSPTSQTVQINNIHTAT